MSGVQLYQIILLCLTKCIVDSARILVVVPTPSISHMIIYQPVIRELSLRGHQVVAISPEPLKDPALTNLTEIDIHDIAYGLWRQQYFMGKSATSKLSAIAQRVAFSQILKTIFELQLSHPDVQTLIKDPNQHFDLVIGEWIYYIGMYAFKKRFNCPLVGIASLALPLGGYDAVGNPAHPAYIVDSIKLSGDLTIWQRFDNLVYMIWNKYYQHFVMIPEYNEVVEKYFGNGISDLAHLMRTVDLILVNSNPIFHVARPNVPAIIEIGGIHIKARKPLPQNIKSILDNATYGAVYFSLGTNMNTTVLGTDLLQVIVNTFKGLPYTFICNWANTELKLPKNMIARTWWPQQDILDHPNVKLFITQGGLQSTEETISSQVPVIGIPFAGDQLQNVDRYVRLGIGKQLLLEEITEKSLTHAIEAVIKNPRYKANIVKISKLLWDQPMPPLERAIWWIEYVLRHGGASHLRSPLVDMSWMQFLMFDILAILLTFLVVIALVAISLIRIIYHWWRRGSHKQKSS